MIPRLALGRLLLGSLLSVSCAIAADEARSVRAAPLSSLGFHPEFSAPATVLSLNDGEVAARTSGAVERISVLVGQAVEAGDTLAELDCADNRLGLAQAEAALDAAEAGLALAERQAARARSLGRDKNVSEELQNQRDSELLTAKAEAARTRSLVQSARLAVARCRIVAPYAGRVMERLAAEGEWVNPGKPLVRLVDDRRLELSAQIGEDLTAAIQENKAFRFESAGNTFPVALRELAPVIDTLGRTREARFTFTRQQALPGASGRLVWQAALLHLPADIPQRRDGGIGIFIAVGDKALFHPIENGLEGHPVPVELPADTLVILEGREGLNDGDAIRIETEPAPDNN